MTDDALVVLRAVVEACEGRLAKSVSTAIVAQRLREQASPSRQWVRVQLRVLYRRGHLRCASNDAGQVSWAATDSGLAYLRSTSTDG